jgi:hypothetical protein
MVNGGMEENTANKLLHDAWIKLRQDYKKPAIEITWQELVAMAKGEEPSDEPHQAFNDAKMALQKLGYKESDAQKAVTTAYMDLKAVKEKEGKKEQDITASELTQAAVSGKKPSATPSAAAPATSVSKSAGAPAPSAQPTAPVSGAASGPAPTTTPTAPVSSPGGAVSKPKTIKLPTLDPKTGKITPVPQDSGSPQQKQPSDSGKIDIKGDDLEWENPESHEIHSISPDQVVSFAKTKPKFLKALKTNPDVYNNYKDMINQKIAQKNGKKNGKKAGGEGSIYHGEKPPVTERLNYINPFNQDNFLL